MPLPSTRAGNCAQGNSTFKTRQTPYNATTRPDLRPWFSTHHITIPDLPPDPEGLDVERYNVKLFIPCPDILPVSQHYRQCNTLAIVIMKLHQLLLRPLLLSKDLLPTLMPSNEIKLVPSISALICEPSMDAKTAIQLHQLPAPAQVPMAAVSESTTVAVCTGQHASSKAK